MKKIKEIAANLGIKYCDEFSGPRTCTTDGYCVAGAFQDGYLQGYLQGDRDAKSKQIFKNMPIVKMKKPGKRK